MIIGDAGVGKSAILVRFADNTFTDSYINTIGVDFKIRTVEVDNTRVKLQIWDTAGQERFRTITSTYYRGTNGVVVVYDVTSDLTFLNVKKWLDEIRENDCNNVPCVLVGNKIDCDRRQVSLEDAEKFAKSKKLVHFETSAKQNLNVADVFLHLTRLGLSEKHDTRKPKNDSVNLKSSKKKSKKGCC